MEARGSWESRRERRRQDRRRRAGFRLHERRSGFDRREVRPDGVGGLYRAFLLRLSREGRLLLAVLLAINLLNLADFSLTTVALQLGIAVEANPVMRVLFADSALAAGIFKAVMVLGVSLLVWNGRRYRRLLETGLLVMALFLAVVFYQIGGLLLLA